MAKKLENKIKLPSKKTIIGLAFLAAGLSFGGVSVSHGISSYEYFKKGTEKSYTAEDSIDDYNAAIAKGAISLAMLPLSFVGYYSSKRFLKNNKKKSKNY
ncbi:MAG: hypothetical protein M1416_02750 [Candidatus Pacearchaeota archaeon]|nr:hypothetical protein [Candidatus Pacearchaeota archaeon]